MQQGISLRMIIEQISRDKGIGADVLIEKPITTRLEEAEEAVGVGGEPRLPRSGRWVANAPVPGPDVWGRTCGGATRPLGVHVKAVTLAASLQFARLREPLPGDPPPGTYHRSYGYSLVFHMPVQCAKSGQVAFPLFGVHGDETDERAVFPVDSRDHVREGVLRGAGQLALGHYQQIDI